MLTLKIKSQDSIKRLLAGFFNFVLYFNFL